MARKGKAYFDNEIDFVRCTGREARAELENLFLKNRISYFIRFENRSFLGKLLNGFRTEVVVFRINSRDAARAADLVAGVPGARIIGRTPEEDWSPKKALRERAGREPEYEEDTEEREDLREGGTATDPFAVGDEDSEGDEEY